METGSIYKRKILVVEDNDINRDILSSILSDNYIVVEAVNGQEGMDIIQKDPTEFSLIILDIQMPVMNGFEFLEIYKEHDQLKQIPIIVTTSEKAEEEKCLVLGASDFVSKPYNPRIILRRVEALIRLRESTLALQETKNELISGLFNEEYFIYYSEMALSKFLDIHYNFILIQIEDVAYIKHVYGKENINNLFRFIGKSLKGINNNVTFGRYSNDRFMCFFDSSLINTDELIQEIKAVLEKGSPISKVKYKFAVYENVDHSTKVSMILNRLMGAIQNILHNYLEDVVYYDESFVKKEERIRFIEQNMEDSLKNNHFIVCYQPKHDVRNGKLAGAEALVRWIHPVQGFISPGDFVPFFEENGFITKLDLYILENTCALLSKRIYEHKKVVPVSINLSRRDLALIDDPKVLDKILEKYKLDKKYIHFEITESFCGESVDVVSKTKMIRDAGYEIEIDDFGSGYSSLELITEIPMDYLKLGMPFIKKICAQKEFGQTIVQLAHIINAKIVAEGVENKLEADVCKELGCDYIQGYYYSKPLAKEEFSNYCDQEI